MKKGLLFIPLFVLAACEINSYDTGDGEYSLMTAEFVEAHSNAEGTVDYVLTDGGDSLALASAVSASWVDTPDTLYRAIFYYDVSDGNVVKARSLVEVPVLAVLPEERFDSVSTDPVDLESVWVSASGKYLNMGLYLKVGSGGGDGSLHVVGIVRDSVAATPDGLNVAYLRFYHDQGGVPEYYSSKYYLSVRCSDISADSVVVAVNTYDGMAVHGLCLSEQ